MRELEFLPDWYPRLRRRRRGVVAQTWVTVVSLAALGVWGASIQREVRAAEADLVALDGEIDRTGEQLRELEELLSLEQKWRQKDLIRSRLGGHVEAAKLINKLEDLLPSEMGVLEVDMTVEDTLRPPPPGLLGAAQVAGSGAGGGAKDQPVDRRLKVRLKGVAPTDVDLATFLARLSSTPYFEQPELTYTRDRTASGHVMREFEITWAVTLTGTVS